MDGAQEPGRPRLPVTGLVLAQLASWLAVIVLLAVGGGGCSPTSFGCWGVAETVRVYAIVLLLPATAVGTALAVGVHALLFGHPGMRWAGYPTRVLVPTLLTVGPAAALVALA